MTDYPAGMAASETWTGDDLLNALQFATQWLDHNRDRVNALNVFPIPDGDTGTNMALTMHASVEAADAADDSSSAGSVAKKVAHGALMGARGNSGVILSQMFRGFAAALAERDTIDGHDLARALAGGREMAYRAVMQPVEGTMLTVIRVAADHADKSANQTSALGTVIKDALAGAEEALARTPDMLAILRQAGVIDAGGQGVVHILEGLCRYAHGDTTITETSTTNEIGADMRFLDDISKLHGEDPFGYCTNFMVFGEGIDFERVRADFAAMGTSAVVVGDDTVLKVHIHTHNPGTVLGYAVKLGDLDQIKIDNMALQTGALVEQRQHAKGASMAGAPVQGTDVAERVDGDIGVVAVAAGEGVAVALRSMGVDRVVHGGQTMNPSTQELLDAVTKLPVDQVVILPNNKNVILAANQVKALTHKAVKVIPSRSLPEGLAALAVFQRDSPLDINEQRMTEALQNVQTVEITRAVRDTQLSGVSIVRGNFIGLVDGDVIASGHDLKDIVTKALASVMEHGPELLTIFVGEEATEECTEALVAISRSLMPDVEIEVLDGGQPYYHYLIAVE